MKRLVRVLVIALSLLGIVVIYLLSGSATTRTVAQYEISITETSIPWVAVKITLTPGKTGFIDLFMRESRLGGENRIRDLCVTQSGKSIANWSLLPRLSDIRRVWLGFSRQPVEITYLVNPLLLKGENPRSYLGVDFGYLRGMATLFTPFTVQDIAAMLRNNDYVGAHAGMATLTAALPPGWSINSPWLHGESMPIAALRNVYMGVGPFMRNSEEGASLHVAVFAGLNQEVAQDQLQLLPSAFAELQRIFGMPPKANASKWAVTVLPDDPLHGGAAGVNSLISISNAQVLVHEMTHWWNGHTIQFVPDMNWVAEGFTTYYEGRVLRDLGWWDETEFNNHLNHQAARLYGQLGSHPVNLSKASVRLLSTSNSGDYAFVYSGGALVAVYLDRELTAQGKSLDDLWPLLASHEGLLSTESFLRALESLGGKDLALECSALVQGLKSIPLP